MAAIYQWFDLYEEEYTTTLYPLEVQDALLMSADFDGGYMEIIDQDDLTMYTYISGGWMKQLLLSAPEQQDNISMYTTITAGWMKQLLLAAPEQEDDLKMWTYLSDGWMATVLITTYMPPQGLLMDADLDSGSCYMVSV
jgi:hypothetical protein